MNNAKLVTKLRKVSYKKGTFSFFYLVIFSLIFFVISNSLNRPSSILRSSYLVPPLVIQNLLTGLKTQASDSFWLRSIQDFDYCDNPINERECKGKSWLYEILNLTTELDSKFYEAFYYGGLALTIIISDYEGASKIFDKGVLAFPTKWNILYAAGYHALFEEKNRMKASHLFLTSSKNGGPSWLSALAARLANESGEKEYAIQILQEMIGSSEDPVLVKHLKKKLLDIQRNR